MVYVAFVIDAFSRRIIGWRAARSMTTALVLDVLEHAIFTRAQQGVTDLTGLVAHSDAGSQYTSIAFTTRLIDAGVDPSVGSVGDALRQRPGRDHRRLVQERTHPPPRPLARVDPRRTRHPLHWVDWFNTERPHEFPRRPHPGEDPRSSTTLTNTPWPNRR